MPTGLRERVKPSSHQTPALKRGACSYPFRVPVAQGMLHYHRGASSVTLGGVRRRSTNAYRSCLSPCLAQSPQVELADEALASLPHQACEPSDKREGSRKKPFDLRERSAFVLGGPYRHMLAQTYKKGKRVLRCPCPKEGTALSSPQLKLEVSRAGVMNRERIIEVSCLSIRYTLL